MKETIKLNDIHDQNYPDDWDNFSTVDQKQIYYDSEKDFVSYEVVIRRNSDGKFFKFRYSDFGRGDRDLLEQTAYEVERKEKMVYYYE